MMIPATEVKHSSTLASLLGELQHYPITTRPASDISVLDVDGYDCGEKWNKMPIDEVLNGNSCYINMRDWPVTAAALTLRAFGVQSANTESLRGLVEEFYLLREENFPDVQSEWGITSEEIAVRAALQGFLLREGMFAGDRASDLGQVARRLYLLQRIARQQSHGMAFMVHYDVAYVHQEENDTANLPLAPHQIAAVKAVVHRRARHVDGRPQTPFTWWQTGILQGLCVLTLAASAISGAEIGLIIQKQAHQPRSGQPVPALLGNAQTSGTNEGGYGVTSVDTSWVTEGQYDTYGKILNHAWELYASRRNIDKTPKGDAYSAFVISFITSESGKEVLKTSVQATESFENTNPEVGKQQVAAIQQLVEAGVIDESGNILLNVEQLKALVKQNPSIITDLINANSFYSRGEVPLMQNAVSSVLGYTYTIRVTHSMK